MQIGSVAVHCSMLNAVCTCSVYNYILARLQTQVLSRAQVPDGMHRREGERRGSVAQETTTVVLSELVLTSHRLQDGHCIYIELKICWLFTFSRLEWKISQKSNICARYLNIYTCNGVYLCSTGYNVYCVCHSLFYITFNSAHRTSLFSFFW